MTGLELLRKHLEAGEALESVMLTLANYMDDDIREELHSETATDNPTLQDAIDFVGAYERRHRAKYGEKFVAG